MSDTGDRHDNFPENKTEFSRFNQDHIQNIRRQKVGDWKNSVTQSLKRSIISVRNRKVFPKGK